MQSIPYDPALVLGNLVDDSALQRVTDVATLEAPADAAQEQLTSLMHAQRSLSMTVQELTGMGIETTPELIKAVTEIEDQIKDAAVTYANAKVVAQKGIVALIGKSPGGLVHSSPESPIDYNKTLIKQMPLSSDSLKLDAQYFSYGSNRQEAMSAISTVKAFVADKTSFLGNSFSSEASGSAQRQASSQYDNHRIVGTLVIAAGCTHKDAVLLAPLVIDPDKAIHVWNSVYKNDQISTDHPRKLVESVINAPDVSGKEPPALKIISGATYGSSFIGMVHVLRNEQTQSSQAMYSAAASLQESMKAGAWFADVEGGFGVSSSFSNDAKRLLSLQQINAHCSVITIGSIPSIKSNEVQLAVKKFAEFDPADMMGKLATLQNATAGDHDSVAKRAEAARTGGQMMAMEATRVTSVMSGLDQIDDKANKILDINSVMTAFEDYVQKAIAGNIGVPINYYIRQIPKAALAHLWVSKYFPQYMAIAEDDSGRGGPALPPGGGQATPPS